MSDGFLRLGVFEKEKPKNEAMCGRCGEVFELLKDTESIIQNFIVNQKNPDHFEVIEKLVMCKSCTEGFFNFWNRGIEKPE